MISNLAGHKFPTGVGFRRAYLEVRALDAEGATLWCSGCSDAAGQLLNRVDGEPLASEYPMRSNTFQPDYAEIDREDQVQIYETRHHNAQKRLSTSFLELDAEVKDNRLLPKGWQGERYPSYELAPVGATLTERSEVDEVTYTMAIDGNAGQVARVQARLYYQALPPYYLLDRIALLAELAPAEVAELAPETQRLAHMLARQELVPKDTRRLVQAIDGWKLAIGVVATQDL